MTLYEVSDINSISTEIFFSASHIYDRFSIFIYFFPASIHTPPFLPFVMHVVSCRVHFIYHFPDSSAPSFVILLLLPPLLPQSRLRQEQVGWRARLALLPTKDFFLGFLSAFSTVSFYFLAKAVSEERLGGIEKRMERTRAGYRGREGETGGVWREEGGYVGREEEIGEPGYRRRGIQNTAISQGVPVRELRLW